MAQPAAFLFDMDGLLLDTERLYCAAFCDTTKILGVQQPEDAAFFHTMVGNSWHHTQQAVTEYLPTSVSFEHFAKEWESVVKTHLAKEVPVKNTVHTVLSRLHDQGAVMAVVTSTQTDHALENLERAGLLKVFKQVTGGDRVSENKPHPAPYLETAADLGVAPSACFAFEDSDKGITSAIRAGCRAVQVPDLRPPNTPFPDLGQHIAKDLAAAMHHLGVF